MKLADASTSACISSISCHVYVLKVGLQRPVPVHGLCCCNRSGELSRRLLIGSGLLATGAAAGAAKAEQDERKGEVGHQEALLDTPDVAGLPSWQC